MRKKKVKKFKVGDLVTTNCGATRRIKEIYNGRSRYYYSLVCLPTDETNSWEVTDEYIRPATKLEKALV